MLKCYEMLKSDFSTTDTCPGTIPGTLETFTAETQGLTLVPETLVPAY